MSLSIYFSTQRTHSRLTRSCLQCTHSPHHASPRPTRAWKPFAMRESPPEGFPYTTHSFTQPSMHSTQSLTRLPCRYAPYAHMPRTQSRPPPRTHAPSGERALPSHARALPSHARLVLSVDRATIHPLGNEYISDESPSIIEYIFAVKMESIEYRSPIIEIETSVSSI